MRRDECKCSPRRPSPTFPTGKKKKTAAIGEAHGEDEDDGVSSAERKERDDLRRRVLLRTPLLMLEKDAMLTGYYLPYAPSCFISQLTPPPFHS